MNEGEEVGGGFNRGRRRNAPRL